MDELIDQLVTTVGISKETAEKAVGIILGFLKEAGPADKVAELMDKLPGASDIETPASGGMGEIQGVTRQLVSYAKQHAGDELVDDVIGSIPGLSQFT